MQNNMVTTSSHFLLDFSYEEYFFYRNFPLSLQQSHIHAGTKRRRVVNFISKGKSP
jgi:hypothetical protein